MKTMPGIIRREIRAAVPMVTALLVSQIIVTAVAVSLNILNSPSPPISIAYLSGSLWMIGFIIVPLLLGALCGAEEMDNGTADFALRLPVTRVRIFTEKIAGAAVAFILWLALSVLLGIVLIMIFDYKFDKDSCMENFFGDGGAGNAKRFALTWPLLMFSSGLAAGAWIERVVPTVIVAALAAPAYFYAVAAMAVGLSFEEMMHGVKGWSLWIVWPGVMLALLVAGARFLTREGK
ncbi:MAG: hypothetical protein NTX50_07860 [Candidatus Sumerlaeota bacterium]|nr:hypothetical protein [Candidatus Sumerlaeota bacterium]